MDLCNKRNTTRVSVGANLIRNFYKRYAQSNQELLFADDAKLYARITCKDDNASLQEDLNRITALLWELPFNEDVQMHAYW